MSVSPTSPAHAVPRLADTSSSRAAQRPENREADRDAWAANLINEMRRASRAQGGPRSL